MPHFVCYAHNSNKKLYNLEDKNKNITIPNQISFYDYKSGRFILARAIILPKEIINSLVLPLIILIKTKKLFSKNSTRKPII